MAKEFVEKQFSFPAYFDCTIAPNQLAELADRPTESKIGKVRELIGYAGLTLAEEASSPIGMRTQELINGIPASVGASEFHLDSASRGVYQLFYADVWPTEFASCTIAFAKRFRTRSLHPAQMSRVLRRVENAVLRKTPFRAHWLELANEYPEKFEKIVRVEDLRIESREGAVAIGKIDETLHRSPVVYGTTGQVRHFTTAFATDYHTYDKDAVDITAVK